MPLEILDGAFVLSAAARHENVPDCDGVPSSDPSCANRADTFPMPVCGSSDPVVPGPPVADVAVHAAVVELVLDDDALQVLHALVADLPLDAQPHRRAVLERQVAAVHAVGE